MTNEQFDRLIEELVEIRKVLEQKAPIAFFNVSDPIEELIGNDSTAGYEEWKDKIAKGIANEIKEKDKEIGEDNDDNKKDDDEASSNGVSFGVN